MTRRTRERVRFNRLRRERIRHPLIEMRWDPHGDVLGVVTMGAREARARDRACRWTSQTRCALPLSSRQRRRNARMWARSMLDVSAWAHADDARRASFEMLAFGVVAHEVFADGSVTFLPGSGREVLDAHRRAALHSAPESR